MCFVMTFYNKINNRDAKIKKVCLAMENIKVMYEYIYIYYPS